MTVASRTPEGEPNLCPLCGGLVRIEPTRPPGDAPCPHCGCLLWFLETTSGVRIHDAAAVAPVWEQVCELVERNLGVKSEDLSRSTSYLDEFSIDSLSVVEVEEEFEINIPDAEAETVKTLNDLLDFIMRRLHEKQDGGDS